METELMYKLPSHDGLTKAESSLEQLRTILDAISEGKRRIYEKENYAKMFGNLFPELARKQLASAQITRKAIRRLRQRFNIIANELSL